MRPDRSLARGQLGDLRPARATVLVLVISGAVALAACGGTAKHSSTQTTPVSSPSPSASKSAAAPSGRLATGMMTSVAGGGSALGDGGPATAASLCGPTDVALGAGGDMYVADAGINCNRPGGNRVRKIAADGTISTLAGGDSLGYSGDGGPAAKAQLNLPFSVATDAAGNLYVADADNARIRKVDPHGVISTFAGTGQRGYSGDGGPASRARLTEPLGVAVDAHGNLYVADFAVVRKIDPAGRISTVAGTGRGFGRFQGLNSGNVPTRFSGAGGPATKAEINPTDVAVDGHGDLYIADGYWVHRVGRDGIIRLVAGTASGRGGRQADGIPATAAAISGPTAITVDPRGNLFISDFTANRVRKVDRHGTITTIAGSSQGPTAQTTGLALALSLDEPLGLTTDGHGLLYIAETQRGRIRAVRYRPR